MHEWALAESVVKSALEAAEKENLKKITEIDIQLGELQQINEEIFKKAIDDILVIEKNKFKDVTINITTRKSKLKCNKCGFVWSFKDMKNKLSTNESEAIHFIPEVAFVHRRCPNCKSPDFEILKGRGVSISTIKGEK